MDVLMRSQQGSAGSSWVGPALVGLGGLLGLSAWGEWASADLAGRGGSATLLDAPLATILLWAAAATIVAGGVAATLGVPDGARLAVAAGLSTAIAVGVFVCVAEAAASLVPNAALPHKLSRYAFGSKAGPGAWGALIVAVGVVGVGSPMARAWTVSAFARLSRHGTGAVVAVGTLAAAGAALFELRRASWLEAATASRTLDATSLPFVAPLTFAAVVMIVIAIGAVLADMLGVGGLLALGSGAVFAVCAAMAISLGELLPGLDIDIDIAPTGAVWVTLALGTGVIAAGVLLLRRGYGLREGIEELIGRIEPYDEPDPNPAYDWSKPANDWNKG
jgi:hypothetical protein